MLDKTKLFVSLILAVTIPFMGCLGQPTDTLEPTAPEPVADSPPSVPKAAEPAEGAVQLGDTVTVNYAGRLKSGELFDTTYEELALEEGIHNPQKNYQPFTFKAGASNVIKGFNEMVIGLRQGQERTVEVPPEDGYGFKNPQKILVINRTQPTPRIVEVPTWKFEEVMGKGVKPKTLVRDHRFPWAFYVRNITAETVTVVYEPEHIGRRIHTIFGNGTVVNVTETQILIYENPEKGSWVNSEAGPAKVDDFTNDSITLDFNHKLAGETLVFTVKLEKLVKAGTG